MAWIAVDLDGTLAEYGELVSEYHIGKPIQPMLDRVKRWLADGVDVRIFTARVCEHEDVDVDTVRAHIEAWCVEHIGRVIPITNVKDYGMVQLWDDRAVAVNPNKGDAFSFRSLL